ncbi:hypothetical protein ACFO6R_06495 [Eubacterium multiforme]|uniref:Outer membrane protein assembly factor BamA n=1 Tax=Eubacterium multiforme TaxID=83339 RepID=A0ABT9USE4_9FIRM|nr:hypothetical protein [Eubacterium multiforme]MDQ0149243.1 outer membrane protein assembly factor BamA [Eubacterium multiforme]
MKAAKCIMELERIWGVRNGSAGKVKILERHNVVPNQKTIADNLNITPKQLQRYKKLTQLIPELQDMVENDKFII